MTTVDPRILKAAKTLYDRHNIDDINRDFRKAVSAARKPLSEGKLRAGTQENGALVDLVVWLLSERPIGPAERWELAFLLSGELNFMGRPGKVDPKRWDEILELVMDAKRWKKELQKKKGRGRGHSDEALEAAAERAAKDPRAQAYGVAAGTLQTYIQAKNPMSKISGGRVAGNISR